MTTCLTVSSVRGFRVGDTVSMSGDTNRMRRRVIEIPTSTIMEIKLYIRPSKGFRRHTRRLKAAA